MSASITGSGGHLGQFVAVTVIAALVKLVRSRIVFEAAINK
jgi:hypothetical protein